MVNELGVLNPYNPEQNNREGVLHLQRILRAFGGDHELDLSDYSAEPVTIRRGGNTIQAYPDTPGCFETIFAMRDLESLTKRTAVQQSYKSFDVDDGPSIPIYADVHPQSEVPTLPHWPCRKNISNAGPPSRVYA